VIHSSEKRQENVLNRIWVNPESLSDEMNENHFNITKNQDWFEKWTSFQRIWTQRRIAVDLNKGRKKKKSDSMHITPASLWNQTKKRDLHLERHSEQQIWMWQEIVEFMWWPKRRIDFVFDESRIKPSVTSRIWVAWLHWSNGDSWKVQTVDK
jgi:hypothetical protein